MESVCTSLLTPAFFILLIRCPETGESTDTLCGVQSLHSAYGFSQPVVKRASSISVVQCAVSSRSCLLDLQRAVRSPRQLTVVLATGTFIMLPVRSFC
jgi:hypothetical protein